MINKIILRSKKLLWHKGIFREKKNPNPTIWGIIGLGYMAETFATAIDGNKNGIIGAVASRSLTKAKCFANKHGNCKYYGAYEAMINDSSLKLDIIYIATPVNLHYEHIKLCLNAGKNVLCEKPITASSEQLLELIKLAQKNKCFFMEGMWMKCLPTFITASKWIQNGNIGNVEFIRTDFDKRRVLDNTINAKHGVLLDYGVYAIAFILNYLDVKDEIEISYVSRKDQRREDTNWQIAVHSNGINATINLSSNFKSQSKAVVIGSKGFIEWESQFNRTNTVTLYDNFGKKIKTSKYNYKYEGFEYEIDEVQKCLKQNLTECSVVSLSASLSTMKIIDVLLKTQENGLERRNILLD